MDSVSKPPARKAGELFISLLDSIADLPEFAELPDRTHWQISPLGGLIGSLYDVAGESPMAILLRWQEQFGGITSATHETRGGDRWHKLETMLDGVDLVLRVPVPQATVEQALREQIAALQAALQAAVDAPVPFDVVEVGGDDVSDAGTGHGSYEYRSGS